jgi:hypothetical protein
MRHHHVCAVLVTGGDRQLVGIFTGRNAVHRVLAEGRSHNTTLAELMTPDPDCITPRQNSDRSAAPDGRGPLPAFAYHRRRERSSKLFRVSTSAA